MENSLRHRRQGIDIRWTKSPFLEGWLVFIQIFIERARKPLCSSRFKDPDFNKSNKNLLRPENGMILASLGSISPRIIQASYL